MRITVVGSGDAFGSGGRFQTCVALGPDGPHGDAPDGDGSSGDDGPDGDGYSGGGTAPHTLLDCGATSMVGLRRQGIDPNAIGTVLLTHLHGDHFGGLPFLVLDGQFRRRTADLAVYGPAGTADRLAAAMEALFPGSAEVRRRFAVRVTEYTDRVPVDTGRLTATPFEVRHASGAPAYAVRVADRDGATVAYSGDTEWTDALIDASAGADVFLCEGYAPAPVRWHLDLETLARHRHRLTCRRLVLTHLSPTALAADLTPWETAHDGLVLSTRPTAT
ncbi:MBL fold metallo-hydrolase [Nocardiopsis trehalosi]|jgi:ribonuclease BN (tRNA processing enzyme)|uniref:MBL fold metallo-hydrolase n=1 Tax=Nocardiopsis trehalosi TaxID=109329 RepID=UPI0008304F2D|nr:MBL fold metallo-hydrolase [Nocardiopsis trehalosi]